MFFNFSFRKRIQHFICYENSQKKKNINKTQFNDRVFLLISARSQQNVGIYALCVVFYAVSYMLSVKCGVCVCRKLGLNVNKNEFYELLTPNEFIFTYFIFSHCLCLRSEHEHGHPKFQISNLIFPLCKQ